MWANVAGVALLVFLVRFVLERYLFKPLAAVIVEGAEKQEKCRESLWKCTAFSFFFVYELYVASRFEWFMDSSLLFTGWPSWQHPAILTQFYHAALAHALAIMFMSQCWEVPRSDRAVTWIHHIITLGLIAGSYSLDFLPVGVMVLLCHDGNDVLMEFAKMCKYAGQELLAAIFFAAFTVLWCFTRLYVFPVVVIRACFVHLNGKFDDVPMGAYVLEALLCSLVVLHVYWTVLIFRVLWRALVSNGLNDVRED